MVRAALVLAVLMASRTAGATELPNRMGLYPTAKNAAPLAMVASAVEVNVHGAIVEVVVTQSFRNDTDHASEATYIFPLPADAAVSAMSIQTGARTIHAAVEKRADAQKRYEDAITAGVSAGLLDEERPDVFTQTVSAIPAHGTVQIVLRYDSVAGYHGGTWQLVLPMVVAPRYVPGAASGRPTTGTGGKPDTDRAPDASRVTPNSAPGAGGPTTVTLAFADEIDDLASPTHELQGMSFTDAKSDHDAIVRWKARASAEGWSEQDGGTGYAAVVVEAPPAKKRTGTLELTLVVDRGAAERGDADAMERPLVRALLGELGRGDTVAVAGSDKIARGAGADVAKEVERVWPTKAKAFDLTRTLKELHGGTIVLVSSGLVADDRAAIAAAVAVGAPIHVIGVGPAPNRALLAALATATNGTIRFAALDDDVAQLAKDVVLDAANPPAALAITWGTLAASDVVPATLPRIGAGQARLVLAKVKTAQAANGRAQGDVFAIAETHGTTVTGATTKLGPLARRWARDRLDEMLATAKPDAAAITALALEYQLVSPYTSMVAIGDEVVVKGGVKHSVAVPVSVPAGMRWQEVERQNRVKEKDKKEETEDDTDVAKKVGGDKPKKHPVDTTAKQPTAPPPPAEAPSSDAQRSPRPSKPADGDTSDADGVAAAGETVTVTGTNPVALREGRDVADEEMTVASATGHRRPRITLSLGGGLARSAGSTDPLAALSARVELGYLTLGGVEGSLWLVGGSVEGQALATVGRRINRFEVGTGLGVHFGIGVGPAIAATLRYHLGAHAGIYLRYDGSLLYHDDTKTGDNAGTAGVEYRW